MSDPVGAWVLVVSDPVGAWVLVVSDPVGADPVGACLRFTRCRVRCFSYYMEKFKPGGRGCGCSRGMGADVPGAWRLVFGFLLKKRTKKRKHESV